MNTDKPSPKPAADPIPGLPWKGEITTQTRLAAIAQAGARLPDDLAGRLATASQKFRGLEQDLESLSLDAVRSQHRHSHEAAVGLILSGASAPEQMRHADSLGRDYEVRRNALVDAKGRLFVSTIDDLMAAGEIVHAAISDLAELLEHNEKIAAAKFNVDFTPSPQLLIVRSVALLVQRRFEGLRSHALSHAANMGSPASYLLDLLPEAANW